MIGLKVKRKGNETKMKFKDTKYGDLTGQEYKGDINVKRMNLTSLEGAPKNVKGSFYCNNLKLTSLEGAPDSVTEYFNCSDNPDLTSLKGSPESVGKSFWCSDNPNNPKLISLEGAPKKVGGSFYCHNNPKLTLLEGTPESIDNNFNCSNNPELTQSEIDKLVKCDIKGKIKVPNGLKAPSKEDYKLYKKLGDRKYWKLKDLKDSL